MRDQTAISTREQDPQFKKDRQAVEIRFDHQTHRQRVIFGTGCVVDNTAKAIEQLDVRASLLIASDSASEVADAIAMETPVARRIDGVVQHVPTQRADAARREAVASSADSIICVGGGSATGLAKAVALVTGLPIVAIPTTFSGSEATDMWGMTVEGRKHTGADLAVLPRTVIYDAALLAGLPVSVAISSVFNAIAHAVDGLWAPRADPINRALAAESLRVLIPAITEMAEQPNSREPRESALYGAYLAAVAFASSGSGMHHKICHVLGGAFLLPHAELHTVMLPYVTAFNAHAAPSAAQLISETLHTTSAAAGLKSLAATTGAPLTLAEIGFPKDKIVEASGRCLEVIPPSNPRPVDLEAVSSLLQAAYEGDAVE
ncbi:maleylacetate reductase [Mycolicibacterium aurum]|uniref:maleylacetate reductase n=1 Tax=Mycolicibacterium aurum TaxID=1791 RepID=UPI001E2FFB05|nr:maleylacetate reductase [Mycolicibacterium aurum]